MDNQFDEKLLTITAEIVSKEPKGFIIKIYKMRLREC